MVIFARVYRGPNDLTGEKGGEGVSPVILRGVRESFAVFLPTKEDAVPSRSRTIPNYSEAFRSIPKHSEPIFFPHSKGLPAFALFKHLLKS